MQLKLMYITNRPDVAAIAQKHGIDRIFIDLETHGKAERQANRGTVQSKHRIEDILEVKSVLSSSQLLVRVNPVNRRSEFEIDAVIKAGVDVVMLPMWKSVDEVQSFLDYVSKRSVICLLLETREAVDCLEKVLALSGIDEIHIGLNDLHISYGLNFLFELLANGTVERICKTIRGYGIPYGFGGIARIGEGIVPAQRIIMEHYRLGSTMAILSRSFCNIDHFDKLSEIERNIYEGMVAIRAFERTLGSCSKADYEANRYAVVNAVSGITQQILDSDEDSA